MKKHIGAVVLLLLCSNCLPTLAFCSGTVQQEDRRRNILVEQSLTHLSASEAFWESLREIQDLTPLAERGYLVAFIERRSIQSVKDLVELINTVEQQAISRMEMFHHVVKISEQSASTMPDSKSSEFGDTDFVKYPVAELSKDKVLRYFDSLYKLGRSINLSFAIEPDSEFREEIPRFREIARILKNICSRLNRPFLDSAIYKREVLIPALKNINRERYFVGFKNLMDSFQAIHGSSQYSNLLRLYSSKRAPSEFSDFRELVNFLETLREAFRLEVALLGENRRLDKRIFRKFLLVVEFGTALMASVEGSLEQSQACYLPVCDVIGECYDILLK